MQCLQEILTIHIVDEDILAPITPAHDMVDGSGILDPHLSWHKRGLDHSAKSKEETNQSMG
jgi:hypothetical protein